MKLSSRKIERNKNIELSMTSMIDVVFLLLIFFMVFSSFLDTERNLDSAIKVNERSASSSDTDLEPAIVEVVKQGETAVYRIGSRSISNADELQTVLDQFPNKSEGAFVRVADDVPFGKAAAAIQACRATNFLSVSYIPLEAGE